MLNTEPRPESYREDYVTANNGSYYASSGIIYPEVEPLNETKKATLYANLASGAESGWDYSSRWLATPRDAADDVYFPLRSLNTANTIGVDVNSILYANEVAIAGYLKADSGSDGDNGDDNRERVAEFEAFARNRSAAMYALMWNEEHEGYFDYNATSGSQNLWVPLSTDSDDDHGENETAAAAAAAAAAVITDGAPDGYQLAFHAAQFYPFWLGAAPAHLRDNPLAVARAYARVGALLDARPGGAVAATNYRTGQQWDRPNVWPPLVYALAKGLLNTPATFGDDDPAFARTRALALRIAQRYLDSTFCTWRATGGATTGDEQRRQLNDSSSTGAGAESRGIMFEKYSDEAKNVAGGGGEYEVVEGFGWTNGVLIWAVDTFGNQLRRPDCGGETEEEEEEEEEESGDKRRRTGTTNPSAAAGLGPRQPRAVELSAADARWTKKFGRRAAGY